MSEETKPPPKMGVERTAGGRFAPGHKAYVNGGRPRLSEAESTMLGDAVVPAIKALIDALGATKTAAFEGQVIPSTEPDHEIRKGAARDLLDRRLGKPAQAITGEDGGPIQFQDFDLTALSDVQFAALVALRDAIKAGK